jgi:murein DD-endopeptidase MepM/ murein hydrolase activator NlpD
MPTFPLKSLPAVPYHKVRGSRGTYFGAPRAGKYSGVHPAVDLIAAPGTEVLAVADGEILGEPYAFAEYSGPHACHSWTYAIEVVHREEGFIARYCEIGKKLSAGLGKGSSVSQGQVIAEVGAQCGGSMLHFEMFKATGRSDRLTDKSNKTYVYVPSADYKRRSDLLDPTPYLDKWMTRATPEP